MCLLDFIAITVIIHFLVVALGIHQPWFSIEVKWTSGGCPSPPNGPIAVSWFSNCAPSHCALWEPSAWSLVGSPVAQAGKITICNPKERGTGLHRKLFPLDVTMSQKISNFSTSICQEPSTFAQEHPNHVFFSRAFFAKKTLAAHWPSGSRFRPSLSAIAEVEREGVTGDIYAAILIHSVQLKYTNMYVCIIMCIYIYIYIINVHTVYGSHFLPGLLRGFAHETSNVYINYRPILSRSHNPPTGHSLPGSCQYV